MSAENIQRKVQPEEKIQGTTPVEKTRFDRAIGILLGKIEFTGEQYVPGSGVEICYDHFGRYAFALQFVDSTTTVLDLGCGIGYGSVLLSEKAKQVISLDRSKDCIAALHDSLTTAGIDNVQCICADAIELVEIPELQNQKIDVVVCHEFIEHVPVEIQNRICELVASAQAPFHEGTLFLVSTPEKDRYAEHRTEPNEFHEHELTEEEFRQLLTKHFAHTQVYSQTNASANFVVPLEVEPEQQLLTQTKFVNWLNPSELLASLQDSPQSRGIFIYGVASQAAFTTPPRQSILLDTSQRVIGEHMSIAALELQKLQAGLVHYRMLHQQQTEEVNRLNHELHHIGASGSDEQLALEQTIQLQADKIKRLLIKAEHVGAERQELFELREQLQTVCPEVQAAMTELLEWRSLGQQRLGPELAAAQHQAAMLWAQAYAISTPGHRFISFIGRNVQKFWLGRKLRSSLKFLSALRQA